MRSKIVAIFVLTTILISCTPIVEKKINQYTAEGKNIINSSLNIETKYNYILYTDESGIWFDNMKDVIKILEFNRTYALCSPHMRIPCGKTGLEITPAYCAYEGDETEMIIKDNILNDYHLYMIGDWAALLKPQSHMPEYTSSLIILPGKDTIYTFASIKKSKSCYNMSYSYSDCVQEETPESYICVDLYGDLLYSDLIDGDVDCQSPLLAYIESTDVKDWLYGDDGPMQIIYEAKYTLTQDDFFTIKNIEEVAFKESWIDTVFNVEKMGAPQMLTRVAQKVTNEYLRYKKEQEEKRLQELIEQIKQNAVTFREVFNTYKDNPIKAKQLYPVGKRMIIAMTLGGIEETPYALSAYSLDPDLISFAGDVLITTNDEDFTKLDYPHYVWMEVLLKDYSKSWTGTFDLRFTDAELLMWE